MHYLQINYMWYDLVTYCLLILLESKNNHMRFWTEVKTLTLLTDIHNRLFHLFLWLNHHSQMECDNIYIYIHLYCFLSIVSGSWFFQETRLDLSHLKDIEVPWALLVLRWWGKLESERQSTIKVIILPISVHQNGHMIVLRLSWWAYLTVSWSNQILMIGLFDS